MDFQGRYVHNQNFTLNEETPQFQNKDQDPFKNSGVVGQSLKSKGPKWKEKKSAKVK